MRKRGYRLLNNFSNIFSINHGFYPLIIIEFKSIIVYL